MEVELYRYNNRKTQNRVVDYFTARCEIIISDPITIGRFVGNVDVPKGNSAPETERNLAMLAILWAQHIKGNGIIFFDLHDPVEVGHITNGPLSFRCKCKYCETLRSEKKRSVWENLSNISEQESGALEEMEKLRKESRQYSAEAEAMQNKVTKEEMDAVNEKIKRQVESAMEELKLKE